MYSNDLESLGTVKPIRRELLALSQIWTLELRICVSYFLSFPHIFLSWGKLTQTKGWTIFWNLIFWTVRFTVINTNYFALGTWHFGQFFLFKTEVLQKWSSFLCQFLLWEDSMSDSDKIRNRYSKYGGRKEIQL